MKSDTNCYSTLCLSFRASCHYTKGTKAMQLGSMFISNCNITLHVSDAFCVHPQEYLKTVVAASGVWPSAESTDLGRPYWILHPISWHTAEAATTVFKYSWGWTQKASETRRIILQLLINILPSCIALVPYIYCYLTSCTVPWWIHWTKLI
jgi:hypothetical protein